MKKLTIMTMILCLTLNLGCVNAPSETVIKPAAVPTAIPTVDVGIVTYNFEWYSTNGISYWDAPKGYKYAVVTYRVKNDGPGMISTSPVFWEFMADGIVYGYDSVSHSDKINTVSVDVYNGGDITTDIVFLVQDDVTHGNLVYSPLYGGDTIRRDLSLSIGPEPTPTPTPWVAPTIAQGDFTLDDEGFLQWYDNQKIYYWRIYTPTNTLCYASHAELQVELERSLTQIDEFGLDGKYHKQLRDTLKEFLEVLQSVDEDRYRAFCSDDHTTSEEQHLEDLWYDCNRLRNTLK